MNSLVPEFPGATWRSLSGLATAILQREIVAREKIWKCMIAIICRYAESMIEKGQCPHLKEILIQQNRRTHGLGQTGRFGINLRGGKTDQNMGGKREISCG